MPSPRFALLVFAALLPWNALADNSGTSPLIAPFRVVTADLRPFAVENQQAEPGLTVELVQSMAARIGRPVKVEFYPWARAYALAETEPRVAVIPLTRTAEREAHFQWLVRLFRQHYVFITKAGNAPIDSIDAAHAIKRIGVLRASPTVDFALAEHFSPSSLAHEVSVEAGLKDLDAGLIDSYYGGLEISTGTINSSGRKLSDYHFGVALGGGEIWLAASGGFTENDIAALRQAFDDLNADGTYAKLLQKYKVAN